MRPKTVLENAVGSIEDAMKQLNRCTVAVQAMLDSPDEEYNRDLASHLSWLAKNAAACLDAMRKQESAERARWKSMGLDDELQLVKVWLDEAPVNARAEVAEHVAGLAAGGGLLS